MSHIQISQSILEKSVVLNIVLMLQNVCHAKFSGYDKLSRQDNCALHRRTQRLFTPKDEEAQKRNRASFSKLNAWEGSCRKRERALLSKS